MDEGTWRTPAEANKLAWRAKHALSVGNVREN